MTTHARMSNFPDPGLLDIDSLIQTGRVHSRLFTDPRIFDLEIERIFHRTWLFIGHTSEVPQPGSFCLRRMGRQPVILVHSSDGAIRVLMNRCRHRGTMVCEIEQGQTKVFRCWYHGWVYDTTGELLDVTGRAAYGADFDQRTFSLTPAPRVEIYRGFVFASLSPSGPDLSSNLGRVKAILDFAIDASPTGQIEARSGSHKTTLRSNWKLIGMDGYHAPFVHASVYEEFHRKSGAGISITHQGNDHDDDSLARARDFGNGHCQLDFGAARLGRSEQYLAFVSKQDGGPQYLKAMRDAYGEARAHELVVRAGDPHLGIFPNMQLVGNQIRIMNPISADRTDIVNYPLRVIGMSEAMNERRLRNHESFYGPAGAGAPDDTEIFERVQQGLMAEVDPWVDISRGLARETVDADGTVSGCMSDEVPQRAVIKRWRELMLTE
jgi:phenylpropionate dioxygenase-like ring-hydroxylating dioxygenase large terminal subunit